MMIQAISKLLKIDTGIITDFKLCYSDEILCHELVVENRFISLKNYLETLQPYIIIPSIIACDKTSVIIDGHHRYQSLITMGIKQIPVTFINYSHSSIVPDLDHLITKEEIIEAALSGNLLKPKSSFHHVINSEGKYFPVILLSSLFSIDNV